MAYHNLHSIDGTIASADEGSFVRIDSTDEKMRFKRPFDVMMALILIAVLTPIFAVICVTLLLTDGRPIFFRHQRIGRHGRMFDCLKFRTMQSNSADLLKRHLALDPEARLEWKANRKLKNDPRVTTLGIAMRKSSMDELPQLFNILRGDMSFVGPRPIVRDEVSYYGRSIAAYMSTRPGLTGPWQISGRSDASYETRVRLDCEYAQNYSLLKDVVIIVKTVPAVLLSKGSY